MGKLARLLLLVHAVALDDPVVPLGPGDGRAEPDLFVGGLFVEDVGADCGDGDVEDAGLDNQSSISVRSDTVLFSRGDANLGNPSPQKIKPRITGEEGQSLHYTPPPRPTPPPAPSPAPREGH